MARSGTPLFLLSAICALLDALLQISVRSGKQKNG
jgi:hypothetical protein